jgi:hypothetical protein
MVIEQRTFQHPQQASLVRLAVYETAGGTSGVQGMPDDPGYLVTEEWHGVSKVVKTLGFEKDRAQAVERLAGRARELELQHYRPVAPAA